MIKDYSNYPLHQKTYGGSELKTSIRLDDGIYMMKTPTHAEENKGDLTGTYYNNVLSEYIGSNVFQLCGFPAQKTHLGYYNGKLVVLCKDFLKNGEHLQEFCTYKNGFFSSRSSGTTAEVSEILQTIAENPAIPNELKNASVQRFWEMFVIDALIGNPDRHNGNWGYIYNENTYQVSLAPVYDCGASLFARLSDQEKETILNDPQMLKLRIYNRPLSALTINHQKIHYHEFLQTLSEPDCKDALIKIVPRIDMRKIHTLIDHISVLSDTNKRFYKTILSGRYEKVLLPAYKKALSKERSGMSVNDNNHAEEGAAYTHKR